MEAPYDNLFQKIGLSSSTVAAIYLRGSRGVGVGTETSDYDYIIVTSDKFSVDQLRVHEGIIDFTMFDLKTFQQEVLDNKIGTMECIFSKPILLNIPDPTETFVLNKVPLLLSTMNVVHNRRLRWKREGAYKHLFIATRYMAYALELIETSRIKDISCMNHLWYEHTAENQLLETSYKKYKVQIKAVFKSLIKMKELPLEPTTILTINYLREFGLRRLCYDHQIDYKRHYEHPNLVQLYYRAYAEPSEMVRECRGLILDEGANWSVVAYPFKRFDGDLKIEKLTAIPDFESYNVYKKYDGSLCLLYYYEDQWRIASSHTPDGSAFLCKRVGNNIMLRDAFWKLFSEKEYKLPEDKDYTYMFEITLKEHVVATEEQTNLIFLGKRNIKTLEETPIQDCTENWEKPAKLDMSESELLMMLKTTNPRNLEGVILHNPTNNCRLKIKTLGFQRLANLYPICTSIKVAASPKFLIERMNLPEFAERCQEFKYNIAFLRYNMKKLFEDVEKVYVTVKESEWQKHPYKKMLFDKKTGKSVEESFEEFSLHRKVEYLT